MAALRVCFYCIPRAPRPSVADAATDARAERASHDILAKVFPPYVTACMRTDGPRYNWRDTARSHSGVTVLFCDIVGFTQMCHKTPPIQVMQFLHAFYTMLDDAMDAYPLL